MAGNRKKILIIVLVAVSIAAGLWVILKAARKTGALSFLDASQKSIDLTSLQRDKFPLMKGLKSREVALYQVYLNDKGKTNLVIDGAWGDLTEDASQQVHGWSVIDPVNYQINLKSREPELIRLAKATQNTIIAP